VTSVVTTGDKVHKMDGHSGVSFLSATGTNNVICVDESQEYQEIEGFGASFTDSAAWLLNQKASSTDRDAAMTKLFSPTQGIGLSFIRNPMGGSDLARYQYSYDDLTSGTDLDLSEFSIAHDQTDIVPLVKQAKTLNPAMKIMASPWSPPAWMKTTNSLFGKVGSTDSVLIDTPENYTAFANYFVKYIQAYQAEAIPIDYISLQNEPEYNPGDYAGMIMHSGQQITVLRDYVLPALTSNSLTTKALVWDHNWDGLWYVEPVLADTTLLNSEQVAGVAWHGYSGTPGVMTTAHELSASKGQYVTEHSGGTWVSDQVDSDFSEIIHTMRNWVKAYVKWSLILNENLGPHSGGCGTCTPLLTVHSTTGAVTYPIEYFTMGQFSKYVRPGATRIYSNNAKGLVNAAFRNPDGSKALVVYNGTASARTFQVQWGNQAFTYTLPGRSGATYVWSGTQSGSYTLNARNQIQASSYSGSMGLRTEVTSDTDGGFSLGYSDNGDVAFYKNVNFGTGLTAVDARVACSGTGGNVELRLGSAGGTLIGTFTIPDTGGWQTWQTVTAAVSGATGVQDLYLVYKGTGNLNWIQFK